MPEEDKVLKLKNASPPKSKKELRAFLGLANYYRKFIPNFASIALPLTDKTRKGNPENIQWDSDCQEAFENLKGQLSQKPIVCLPDPKSQYTLRTDASDRGVGAVLLQEHDGDLRPVAYAGRKLSDAEAKYATIEKECLAVIWALKKFKPYIYGTQFVIETDHQPLQYLKKTKTENGRLMRWALQLQPYSYQLRVIKGSENVGADYLSRSSLL